MFVYEASLGNSLTNDSHNLSIPLTGGPAAGREAQKESEVQAGQTEENMIGFYKEDIHSHSFNGSKTKLNRFLDSDLKNLSHKRCFLSKRTR